MNKFTLLGIKCPPPLTKTNYPVPFFFAQFKSIANLLVTICFFCFFNKLSAQEYTNQLPRFSYHVVGNGDIFSPAAQGNLPSNYIYRYPVPKAEGVCSLKISFHFADLAQYNQLHQYLIGIKLFLNSVYNPHDIYFEYEDHTMSNVTYSSSHNLSSIVNAPIVQQQFSSSAINIFLITGSNIEYEPGREAHGGIYSCPSSYLGLALMTSSPTPINQKINNRITSFYLGLAMGLFPTTGLPFFNDLHYNGPMDLVGSYPIESQECHDAMGGDFICDTPPTPEISSNLGSSSLNIDWTSCMSGNLSTGLPLPLKNIMAPIDFDKDCPSEITIEQGRKIRYNIINDPRLYNALNNASTMTFLGYMNVPLTPNFISQSVTWPYPAILQNLEISSNVSFESSSLIEITPTTIYRNQVILDQVNGFFDVEYEHFDFDGLVIKTNKGAEFKLNGGELDGYKPFKFNWNKIELIGASNEHQSTESYF